MDIRAAKPNDLNTLITWIPDEQACRTWAGPQVGFPLEKDRLSVEIGFSSDNSFCLVDNESMVAFGQLLSLRPAYLHMARIIVDPTRRNQSYGRKLCQGLVRITREKGFHNISLNVYGTLMSRPKTEKPTVPKSPKTNAVIRFAWGLICHKIAPPIAANATTMSRIR
jgi:ribosomal protein S18 acetylase RimI-like enzyme